MSKLLERIRAMPNDIYDRKKVGDDEFSCGCHWTRHPDYGDVLVHCRFHEQASEAITKALEKEQEERQK